MQESNRSWVYFWRRDQELNLREKLGSHGLRLKEEDSIKIYDKPKFNMPNTTHRVIKTHGLGQTCMGLIVHGLDLREELSHGRLDLRKEPNTTNLIF